MFITGMRLFASCSFVTLSVTGIPGGWEEVVFREELGMGVFKL